MDSDVIRPIGEGMGTEGLIQTQGIGLTEGLGVMEGTAKSVTSRLPTARAASAAPKSPRRSGLPSMRSAVVWAEILGKPKALRGRR